MLFALLPLRLLTVDFTLLCRPNAGWTTPPGKFCIRQVHSGRAEHLRMSVKKPTLNGRFTSEMTGARFKIRTDWKELESQLAWVHKNPIRSNLLAEAKFARRPVG